MQRMTRREFVRAAAMTGAAVGVGERALAQGPGVRLGVASYTFRQFDRAQVIAWMKQLEVHTINLKDVKDHLPSSSPEAEMAAVADYRAAGIRPTAVGTIYFPKDEDDDIRGKFEYAKRAGAGVIVAGDPEPKVLPRIERFVKEYDIKFALHNHGPEDKLWKSPLDVLAAMKGMDVRMGCCIDVGHTMRAGTDPVEAIKAAGARLHDVHMKDLAQKDDKESQVAVGQGIMPVKAIFEQLRRQRYPGYVDLEYEIHGDDPMPGVTESFAFMRKVLAEMK